LKSFYKTAFDDDAMHIILFFLPGIIYRIPKNVETVLDLGAGPTVYVPIVFRKKAKHIYTSDFSIKNLKALRDWVCDKSNFDWNNVCQWIIDIENSFLSPKFIQNNMNVFKKNLLESIYYYKDKKYNNEINKFDVIVTIFCFEYASETLREYQCAVKNTVECIKTDGYLVRFFEKS
uniref:NNMT/PNMT/TEMT family protein n=1 Tax=Dracunculus medinensis TaxID=318479 RepID=A0A0N4UL82_DRAME